MTASPGRMSGAATRSVAVGAAVGVALFGSFLLVLTPDLGGHPGLQTLWVVVSLVLLKLPLLGLVWWLIARRRRAPTARWSAAETARFLAALDAEAARVEDLPDAAPRLQALHADAWRAAREGDAQATPAAVEIGLRIDRMRRREARPAPPAEISPM